MKHENEKKIPINNKMMVVHKSRNKKFFFLNGLQNMAIWRRGKKWNNVSMTECLREKKSKVFSIQNFERIKYFLLCYNNQTHTQESIYTIDNWWLRTQKHTMDGWMDRSIDRMIDWLYEWIDVMEK